MNQSEYIMQIVDGPHGDNYIFQLVDITTDDPPIESGLAWDQPFQAIEAAAKLLTALDLEGKVPLMDLEGTRIDVRKGHDSITVSPAGTLSPPDQVEIQDSVEWLQEAMLLCGFDIHPAILHRALLLHRLFLRSGNQTTVEDIRVIRKEMTQLYKPDDQGTS